MPILKQAVLVIRDDAHHQRVLIRIDVLTKKSLSNASPGKRRQAAANLQILQEMADDYLAKNLTLPDAQ